MAGIVKFNKDSHFQRIKAHYIDESVSLTDFETEMLTRMKFVFSLRLKNKYSRQQAVKKCSDEFGVSLATAYRDYGAASNLYGELDDVDTRGEKMVLREEYWFLYQQNIKDRNWAEAKKTLDSYKDLFDFTDRSGDIDPDKIAAHNYYIKISKKLEKLITDKVSDGVIDLNSLGIEDIDYEDVGDGGK